MSIPLIQQYHAKVKQLLRYGGSHNESPLRKPFQDLLEHYARAKSLVLVAEVELLTNKGARIRPDGALKDALRQDWGYWESKDERDDLAAEIAAKLAKGYPSFNILFDDTRTAILYQNGAEVARAAMTDARGDKTHQGPAPHPAPHRPQSQRPDRDRHPQHPARRAARSMGLSPRRLHGAGMGARTPQRKKAQSPHHRRKI